MTKITMTIWGAVAVLISSYILWDALNSFNNKDLVKACIFMVIGIGASCILHLRTCLKDHKDIYDKAEEINKNIKRIMGDMPN